MNAAEAGPIIQLVAVIIAVTADQPRVLTVGEAAPGAAVALPSGPLDPAGDRTLERALRSWVHRQSGLQLGYVEQLYTFGDAGRRDADGRRILSVAYLALVHEQQLAPAAGWQDCYGFLPWEDWRSGRPPILESAIAALRAGPARAGTLAPDLAERREIAFGLGEAGWDPERSLARYELLYEAGAVAEAAIDRALPLEARASPTLGGPAMAQDHRRILATALSRLRGKIKYRPVVFELLPERFTLSQLQQVVEALAGVRLHKQNFRRLVEQGGLVTSTGEYDYGTGGRPAKLFRFRRRVLRERAAPGLRVTPATTGT